MAHPHVLTLDLSEDAYQGDAEFVVSVDGVQVGGVHEVVATRAAHEAQQLTLVGSLGDGPHQVAVTFINDAYGGTPETDRNLIVNQVTVDGKAQVKNDVLYAQGSTDTTTILTPDAPAADTLVLNVCDDNFLGDPQFTVAVDGADTGQTYTAAASHYGKQSENVTIQGAWGAGQHNVVVTYINDLADQPGQRNLYVNYASYDGALQPVHGGLFFTGDAMTFSVTAPTPQQAAAPGLQLLGVNLSGAEFGVNLLNTWQANIGVDGVNYVFPTVAELDSYAAEGLNVVRIPITWERLQPVQGGPLDQAYLSELDKLVDHAGALGMKAIIDIHNYGYGYGSPVGSDGTPVSSFVDVWSRLGSHYAGSSSAVFDLMNEPSMQTPAEWLAAVNPAIAAIRAAGATNEILVPGTYNENGDSWVSSGNAAVFAEHVVDPGHNYAFELHQYNNWDESGGDTSVVSANIGVDRLVDATAWAEATGNRLFLGEFGAGTDNASLLAMNNQLAFLQQHSDVWQGGTEWGGGPWWPQGYAFTTEPVGGAASIQVQVLQQFLPAK